MSMYMDVDLKLAQFWHKRGKMFICVVNGLQLINGDEKKNRGYKTLGKMSILQQIIQAKPLLAEILLRPMQV